MIRFKEYIKEFRVWTPKHSKGISRGHMPQVNSKDYNELLKYLKSRDISYTEKTVKANKLKATQRNFNKDKIVKAIGNYHTLHKAKPIIVSKDGYVIDGHHRWISARNVNGDIRIYQTDADSDELLKAVREFPKSYTKTIKEEMEWDTV